MNYKDLKLCFVKGNAAFFAPFKASNVNYIDFDEVPTTYNDGQHNQEIKFEIVLFRCEDINLSYDDLDSSILAKEISRHDISWMKTNIHRQGGKCKHLWADASISEFEAFIEAHDGQVFYPKGWVHETEHSKL